MVARGTMICDKCGKTYDDSFAYCPFCGDKTLEPTKECPFCAETIKAEAVKCRYCHSKLERTNPETEEEEPTGDGGEQNLIPPVPSRKQLVRWSRSSLVRSRSLSQRVRKKLTWRTAFYSSCFAISIISICLIAFFILYHYQGQHYQNGQDALSRQDYATAMIEFGKAGSYRNANNLLSLTMKYDKALDLMKTEKWGEACSLLEEVQKVDNGFQEVAGKIDYIENCPQSPVAFSTWDFLALRSSGNYSVKILNLLGKPIGKISLLVGWNYANHGRSDLVSTISIGGGTIIAASDQPEYRRPYVTLVVANPGQQVSFTDGTRNYCCTVISAEVVGRFTFPDGGYANDPVITALALQIDVAPR